MPRSFTKRWQMIGQKGRQLWITRHYIRILGAVDDVFGKAAGGVKVRWYDIKCDDDMVQLKVVLSESRGHSSGEYMCLRLKRQEDGVAGLVVREIGKMSNKYGIDCEFWGDGSKRRAYKFHLTDTPTWLDLVAKNDAVVKASGDMKMKVCGEIPEGFHGEWKLARNDKIVEFRSKYYRAYGAAGKDPFWRMNTELTFYSLLCNPRRIVLKLYMWELPPGSRSQLQCITLDKNGEYDMTGHAVNMVASKSPSLQTPEIDCDHGIGNGYTRYPLHLTRQIADKLAPQPLGALPEHHGMKQLDDFDHSRMDMSELVDDGIAEDTPGHQVAEKVTHHKQDQPSNPAPASHHRVADEKEHEEHTAQGYSAVESSVEDSLPVEQLPPEQDISHHSQLPYPKPLPYMPMPSYGKWPRLSAYQPYAYAYPYPHFSPPYWMGKRTLHNDTQDTLKREVIDYGDYDDQSDEISINKELLTAIKKQNELLKNGFAKLSAYIDKSSITTTEDWNYVKPYHKQEISESNDKRELKYAYYDDD